jgi:hypothetical protein
MLASTTCTAVTHRWHPPRPPTTPASCRPLENPTLTLTKRRLGCPGDVGRALPLNTLPSQAAGPSLPPPPPLVSIGGGTGDRDVSRTRDLGKPEGLGEALQPSPRPSSARPHWRSRAAGTWGGGGACGGGACPAEARAGPGPWLWGVRATETRWASCATSTNARSTSAMHSRGSDTPARWPTPWAAHSSLPEPPLALRRPPATQDTIGTCRS